MNSPKGHFRALAEKDRIEQTLSEVVRVLEGIREVRCFANHLVLSMEASLRRGRALGLSLRHWTCGLVKESRRPHVSRLGIAV